MKYLISFILGGVLAYWLEVSTFSPDTSKEVPFLLYLAGAFSFLLAYIGYRGIKAIIKNLYSEEIL